MNQMVAIERIDHIGIRVRDLDRALNFYRVLGFDLLHQATNDDVAIIRNQNGVELNLIFNANAGEPNANVLMDAPSKYPGYTHMALRVASIPATIAALKANDIAITQGPVSFGESGHVSVFVRDPDRNVIELRGRDQGIIEGVTRYEPKAVRLRISRRSGMGQPFAFGGYGTSGGSARLFRSFRGRADYRLLQRATA